jgi:hypothetical protein
MDNNNVVETRWTPFRRSSFCEAGSCVEVSFSSGGDARLRDSKDPHGHSLSFTEKEWSAFLSGVRNGEFDGSAS